MNKWRSCGLVLVAALLLVGGAAQVRAQGPTETPTQTPTPTSTVVYQWQHTWNLAAGLQGFSVTWGTATGAGIEVVDTPANNRMVKISKEFLYAGGHIGYLSVTVSNYTAGNYNALDVYDALHSAPELIQITQGNAHGGTFYQSWYCCNTPPYEVDNTNGNGINFELLTDYNTSTKTGWGAIYEVTIRGYGQDPWEAEPPTSTPSITPSITYTPSTTATRTATSTYAVGQLFPTIDYRPVCTMTPVASMTATRPSYFEVTPTMTWCEYIYSEGGIAPGSTPRPGESCAQTPFAYTPRPSPTEISLYARVTSWSGGEGGCRLPQDPNEFGPQVDVSIDDYARDENGEILHPCYTIFPYIDIGVPQLVLDAISTLTGQMGLTTENTRLTIDDLEICVKYRKLGLVILGVDWMPLASGVMSFGIALFMIRTIRYEQ